MEKSQNTNNMNERFSATEMKQQDIKLLPARQQTASRYPKNPLYGEEYKLMQQAGFELTRYQLILDLNRIGVMEASPHCHAALGRPGIFECLFDEEKHQLVFTGDDEYGEGWMMALNTIDNCIEVLNCGSYLHYLADRMDWLDDSDETAVYFVNGRLAEICRLVFDLDHAFKITYSEEEQKSKRYKDREEYYVSRYLRILESKPEID